MFSRHHLRTGSHGVQVFSCKDSRKDLNTGRDEIFFKSSGNQNGIDRGRIRRPEGDTRCSGIGFNLGELFFIDDRDIDPVLVAPFFELENTNSPICSGRRPSFISEIGTSSCLPEVDCPRPSYARGRTGNRHSRSEHTEQSGKLGGSVIWKEDSDTSKQTDVLKPARLKRSQEFPAPLFTHSPLSL